MYTKIVGVIQGPFTTDEIPGWDHENGWVLVCKVQEGRKFVVDEVFFEDLEEAYDVINVIAAGLGPYLLEVDDE